MPVGGGNGAIVDGDSLGVAIGEVESKNDGEEVGNWVDSIVGNTLGAGDDRIDGKLLFVLKAVGFAVDTFGDFDIDGFKVDCFFVGDSEGKFDGEIVEVCLSVDFNWTKC